MSKKPNTPHQFCEFTTGGALPSPFHKKGWLGHYSASAPRMFIMNNLKNKNFLKKLGKIGAGLFSVSRYLIFERLAVLAHKASLKSGVRTKQLVLTASRPQKGRAFWRTENKFHIILAVIIILAVFVPWHQASAFWPFDWVGTKVTEYLGGSLFDATFGALFGAIGNIVRDFIKGGIAWAAIFLNWVIGYQTDNAIYGIAVIDGSWTIIRNFVNLLFILVLIVMAFGTIFNIQRYTWKNMLAPFLIAALLINFSLVIGQYIITVANGLSRVFLNEIMSVSSAGISGIFGQGADIPDTAALVNETGGLIVEGFFSIIFLAIFLLAIVATALFSLARIFMLWFLLIISPIAWFGYTMPNLRSGTWSAWWKHFLCWCFWLPYFLFFVMFAVIFINGRGLITTPPQTSIAGVNVMFFGLSLIFLIGGMAISRKLACASGTGVKAVFGKIETGVRKYAPGAAYVRATYGGAKEGLAAKAEEIKERGVPIGFGRRFGGEQAERLRAARVAERFGMGAKVGEAGRVQIAEIEKEAKRVREQLLRTPADEQRKLLENARSQRGVIGQAAELEFVKQGYSKLEDYQKAVEKYGGETSAFMRQYLENLKQANLSDLFKDPDTELRMAKGGDKREIVELVNLRRELYKDLAKRNQISNLEDYKEAKQLLEPIPAELKSFLDSIKPEYIVGTRDARQDAIRNRTLGDIELERKLVEFMKDKKEINDVQLRQSALDVVKSGTTAGKDTIEGRNLINEINKFNPIINIEANLREEKGVPVGQLDEESQNRIVRELSDKISEMESGDIRKLSGDFFKNPAAQKAFHQIFKNDAEGLSELLKGASKEMRIALKDLASGGTPGGGTAKRRAGFIS